MNELDKLDEFLVELSNYNREDCFGCLCSSCANPDCTRSLCTSLPTFPCVQSVCSTYETQGHYYYDDNGNEYWIGKDDRRHYTRDEG